VGIRITTNTCVINLKIIVMAKVNRFNGWVALVAFSCVVLGTLVQDFPQSVRGPRENYVIACCAIAIFLGFAAVCMYFFFENHVGTTMESINGSVVCALWAAAIAIIQNPRNSLAIEEVQSSRQIEIRNTNLYFFSWASFIASAYLLTSVAQDHDVVNVRAVPTKLMRWYMLLVCSVVVLGIGSRLKGLTCSTSSGFGFEQETCRRTDYSVSFGVITAALAVIPITLSHLGWMKAFVEAPIAVIVLAFYCVGVAVITDNVYGPASNVGNLYFASWIGFSLSVLLAFTSMKELCVSEETSQESESNVSKSERGEAENVARNPDTGEQGDNESGEA
jgi:hypothetical protein